MDIPKQAALADISPEYAAFLDKFKSKKTTDDCYTPPNIYEAVAAWVERRYSVSRSAFVRPFWPGADYKTFDHPPGCIVVDNPPFSIVGKIVAWYNHWGIRYFLFAPYLTNMGIGRGTDCGHVFAPWSVRYENGAEVATSFVTNLDPDTIAETAPDLREAIGRADEENRAAARKDLPKYSYPPDVLSSAGMGYIANHGVRFRVRRGDALFIRKLDAQGERRIFGGGLLLSERAASERAAAERAAAERAAAERAASERAAAERAAAERASAETFALSPREREWQRSLANGSPIPPCIPFRTPTAIAQNEESR